MTWAHPENIIWLLIVPILIGLAVYSYRWKMRARQEFADFNLIGKLFETHSKSRFWRKIILVSLGVFFGVLALMDPLYGTEEVEIKREGIDIVYALDLSNSMYVEDIAPSRLERAKKIIEESVSRLGGDRAGLIVFAADAYSISPLTTDYSAIKTYVDTATPELISYQGTNFSEVLKTASEMFGVSLTTGKMLVILSDGEDTDDSVAKAVELAKRHNIHIAALGLGTEKGGPIPMRMGRFEEYKLDATGRTVISKLDDSSLRSIASASSGKYIYVQQTEETLTQLHSFLNTLDKEVQDVALNKDRKHVFQWFLALALLLIFIDTLTPEHKVFNNNKD